MARIARLTKVLPSVFYSQEAQAIDDTFKHILSLPVQDTCARLEILRPQPFCQCDGFWVWGVVGVDIDLLLNLLLNRCLWWLSRWTLWELLLWLTWLCWLPWLALLLSLHLCGLLSGGALL